MLAAISGLTVPTLPVSASTSGAGGVPVPALVSPVTPPRPETLSGGFSARAAAGLSTPATQPPPAAPAQRYIGARGYVGGVSTIAGHTITSDVYANPDGTHTSLVHSEPINYQAADGSWHTIDNTITTVGGQTGFHNKAGPIDVAFGAAANAARLVTVGADADSLTFGLTGAAASPPAATGSTLDYVGVFPNTDLVYDLNSTALRETFVLTHPPDSGNGVSYDFSLGSLCAGCQALVQTDGSITIMRGAATLYTIPAPQVSDSSPGPLLGFAEPTTAPIHSALVTQGGVYHLRISVDQAWLTSSARTYPVFIDPTLDFGAARSGGGDDAFTQDSSPNWNGHVYSSSQARYIQQLGYYNSTTGNNRPFFHYNLSSLNGAQIQSAAWNGYFSWSSTTSWTPYYLHVVAGSWAANSITWNNMPPIYSNLVKGDNATRGVWRSVDFTDWVTDWTNGSLVNNGIEVDVGDSNDQGRWKNISDDQNNDAYNSDIAVTYNFPPPMTTPITPGNGSSSHTVTPALTVNPVSDPDGDTIQYYFRVAQSSDAETNVVYNSGWTSSSTLSIPSSANLLPNRPYYWHVYTYDGTYETTPSWVWSYTPTDTAPTPPSATAPADGATTATAQPSFTGTASTDPESDPVSYIFTVYTDPGGTGQVVTSGNVNAPSWTPPSNVLNDGATYYWTVAATDLWLSSASSTPRRFKINLGLGAQSTQPADSLGPATVNLSNGNLFVSAVLPSFQAVGGSVGLGLAYNSQKPTHQGLTAQYFNDSNANRQVDSWEPSVLTRVDSTVDFNWNGQSPYPGVNRTDFLVTWSGYVTAPNTGSYQFGTMADDGTRIQVGTSGGVNIVCPCELDNWGGGAAPAAPVFGSAVSLVAGQSQPITVQYYQASGTSSVQLWVSGPGGPNSTQLQAPVPASWLTTDVPGLPDGWSLSTAGGPQITSAHITDKQVTLFDVSGRSHNYNFTGTGWVPPAGEDGVLAVDAASGKLTLHSNDGYTYVFNADGTLSSATSPANDLAPAALTYSYTGTPSHLGQITDPVSQRSIVLDYAGACPTPPAPFSAPPSFLLCKVDYSAFAGGESDLYYSNGHLARIVNPGAATTDFGYDTSGRLTQIRDVLNNDLIACGPSACATYYGSDTPTTIGTDLAHMWTATYNAAGQVASITAPVPGAGLPQPAHSYSYDAGATRVHDALIPDNSSGYVRRVTYDSVHRTLQDFDLAAKPSATNTWSANDQLLGTTDATNIETTHIYDPAQRPTDTYGPGSPSEFAANGTSTSAPHTSTAYDGSLNYLAASWWGNKDLSGLPLTHSTSAGQETSATLPTQLPPQNFSGRLTGEIDLPSSGIYGFNVTAASGARLYIDDQKILDSWGGPYVSAVQSDRPVGYWRLGETSGATTATDAEQQYPGTYLNSPGLGAPGAVTGDTDTAASFNGTTQTVAVPAQTQLSGNFTVEAWIKPASTPSAIGLVGSRGPSDGSFDIQIVPGGLHTDIGNGTTWLSTSADAPNSLQTGVWSQVAEAVTPTSWTIYVDGTQRATGTLPAGSNPLLWDPQHQLQIGSIGQTGWHPFNGGIDEVSVYAGALSANRVNAHYQQATLPSYTATGNTAAYPNVVKADYPVSYWRLDEGGGSTIATDAEQINPGAYVNSPVLGASGALASDPDTAVSLNGVNQSVTVPPQDTIGGTYSVEAWMQASTTTGNFGVLGTRAPSDGGFDIQIHNDVVHADIGDGTNWLTNTADAPMPIAVNTWYQVVYTVAPGSWTVYINGTKAASGTMLPGTPLLWDSTHQFHIGDIGNVWEPFNGKIDDVSVYGVALTAAQVANHYTAGTNPSAPVTGAPTPLTAGPHRIRLEYQDLAASAQVSLNWIPPGGTLQQVPATDLKPRLGLVTSQNDADGKTTQTAYAAPLIGLPTSTTVDPGTGHLNLVTATTYEPPGANAYYRILSTIPPKGAAGNVTYSYYGGTQTANNPCPGGATAINQAGLLKSDTGPTPASGSAIVHDYVYDAAGRIVATRVHTDSNWTCATYDARGRVISTTDSLGRASSTDYSIPDRVTSTRPDSGGTMRTTVNVLDWLGRSSSYTDENGNQTRIAYDRAGRVTDTYRTFSGKSEIHLTASTYDPATGFESALTEFVSTAPQTTTFTYDDAGRLRTQSRPNNVVTTNTYDPARGWLTQMSNVVNGNQLSLWSYQRSASGREQVETGDNRTRTFTYDAAGRLVKAVDSPGATRQYAYDANTNRCANASSCATPTYTYDNADRLLSSPSGSGYIYDTHGNLVSATPAPCSGCATKELITYDAYNHATSIDDGIQLTADRLAASGRMLQRTVTQDVGGATTEDTTFGYSDSGDSPAYSTTGATITTYITGPGGLLVIDSGGTPTYPISNGHADLVGSTTSTGTYTALPDSDEFGVTIASVSELSWLGGRQRYQVPGPLGLVGMGARLYDTHLGRFLEVDPVSGGSANGYDYCAADPVNSLDLSGTMVTVNDGGGTWNTRINADICAFTACISKSPPGFGSPHSTEIVNGVALSHVGSEHSPLFMVAGPIEGYHWHWWLMMPTFAPWQDYGAIGNQVSPGEVVVETGPHTGQFTDLLKNRIFIIADPGDINSALDPNPVPVTGGDWIITSLPGPP